MSLGPFIILAIKIILYGGPMKKSFYFVVVGLFSLFMFIGCASIPASKVTYDVEVSYENESPAVTVEITPSWSQNLIYGDGIGGFVCTFTNNTDKVAKVVWDESSINYNGSSYVPFLEGQKYINAQEPMSPTAIAKGGTLSKAVYSSNQPHYTSGKYGGWSMMPMASDYVQLLFMVKAGDKEEYVTVDVTTIIAEE